MLGSLCELLFNCNHIVKWVLSTLKGEKPEVEEIAEVVQLVYGRAMSQVGDVAPVPT